MVDEYHTPSQNDAADDCNGGRNRANEGQGGGGGAGGGGGGGGGEESNLLFSCQCDSARKVATLLSCLRRVVTGGGGAGSSSFASSFPGGGGGNNGAAVRRHRSGTGTQPSAAAAAAAMAVSGGSASRVQHATVYAGPAGLTFHVRHGLAGQSQCSVDMPRSLFREYLVGEEEVWLEDDDDDDDDSADDDSADDGTRARGRRPRRCTREIIRGGEFGVNLTTVLECFSILSRTGNRPSSSSAGGNGGGGGGGGGGEYASLSNVPLCMSYDRGTATFHLEFLEGGTLSSSSSSAVSASAGPVGCLVTCEVPGVEVADDVYDGPDDTTSIVDGRSRRRQEQEQQQQQQYGAAASDGNNSGLAAAFRSSPLVSRAILYSDALQSAVSEMYDVPGASVARVSLTHAGLEFGCVGPRSEVSVNVPYHRGQGGLYVGLECYSQDAPSFGVAAAAAPSSSGGGSGNDTIARRYPLGAFLSGMRGLDIGVETCISVNARGMMAIQHQVSRAEDGAGGNARPSFVDFIMTCIEDEEEDDNGGLTSRGDVGVQSRTRRHSGLQDITNAESDDLGGGKARAASSRENRPRAAAAVSTSGERRKLSSSEEEEEEEEENRVRNSGKNGKCYDDADSDGDFDGTDGGAYDGGEHDTVLIDDTDVVVTGPKRPPNNRDNATNHLQGELEIDQDLPSSHNSRPLSGQGRKNALEDIRRRRKELHQQRQSFEQRRDLLSDEDGGDDDKNGVDRRRKYKDSSDDRKRVGVTSKAGSHKARHSEKGVDYSDKHSNLPNEDNDGMMRNDSQSDRSTHHSNPAQDSQTQSDDDDGDATELEDSLDVTAEIPNLFSKRSSLSTSAHGGGKRRKGFRGSNDRYSDDDDESESEMEQEPRMMYGETKLEFTQDGYSD
ncbi:hypothetical protein ACHAW5_005949 [Stephanodiscus triporus]|uniref:Uncharacterized protein n=1 Tax=Stephanodiscus triporus TaxID=2934178 RepID=A0ABD3NG19_9STRA